MYFPELRAWLVTLVIRLITSIIIVTLFSNLLALGNEQCGGYQRIVGQPARADGSCDSRAR